MLFCREEKVFSLSRTAVVVPYSDVSLLFSELYCYLLIAGLFREGCGIGGLRYVVSNISEDSFTLSEGSYANGLGYLISDGLKKRFDALYHHRDLSHREQDLLATLDAIFSNNRAWYSALKGKDLLSVAHNRNFSEDMIAVAHYVAVAFGQYDHAPSVDLPKLYISVFGNIHLSKTETVTLDQPQLIYGSTIEDGSDVTTLWAIVSAMVGTLSQTTDGPMPGNMLGETLASFAFMSEHSEFEKSIPIPTFAQALYVQRLMGLDEYNPVSLSASFYNDFLFGTTDSLKVSRQTLLLMVLDLMMKKTGDARRDHLFPANSFYRKLATTKTISSTNPKRPAIFQFALEALAPEETDDTNSEDTSSSDEDVTEDPQDEDGGYDPSNPLPSALAVTPVMDKDTIDLVSFDKTGEGVNEYLYRQAVVALNDRLRSDDTLPISAETREALDAWVDGWIFRTAISATVDQIAALNLQSYLKNILDKG